MLARRALQLLKRSKKLSHGEQLRMPRSLNWNTLYTSQFTIENNCCRRNFNTNHHHLFNSRSYHHHQQHLVYSNKIGQTRRTMLTLSEKLQEFQRDVADAKNLQWGYSKDQGPETWPKTFPIAAGKRQSPIDIPLSDVQYDESLRDTGLDFTYKDRDCVIMINTGFSWRIGVTNRASSTLQLGFREGEYQLQQIHSHWCSGTRNGSEHLVDGQGYASEVHIVHFNWKYGTLGEAINHEDGVVVLGVFVEEGAHNDAFDGILAKLDEVSFKSDTAELTHGFHVKSLLPDNIQDFWTYDGSLTNPPCKECVTWVVFRHPITISKQQLDRMRELHIVDKEHAGENPTKMSCIVRPPQPLNGRVVRSSFL